MRKRALCNLLLVAAGGCAGGDSVARETGLANDASAEVIALERGALDRWIRADPDGYLGLYATDVTYFDPTTEKRIDGQSAMQARLAPVRNVKFPFTEPRYEMIAPKVQQYGNAALLTYNLVNYGKVGGAPESVISRWNSSALYSRIDGAWKIVHSHWSFVQPAIKQAGL